MTRRCSSRIVRGAGILLALVLLGAGVARAQSFTRILTGDPVDDGGASRSVNWVDTDGDGHLDLFVTNGPTQGQDNFLYRGDGFPSYGFTRVLDDVIVHDGGKSDGSSWGDYDNDGDADCFVVNWYGDDNLMYQNNGDGTFTQIIEGPPVTDGGHSETCSWGDYDNDGFLDLYVSNSGDGVAEANFLYHNEGDGTFVRVLSGPPVEELHLSRGVTWADTDDDGDVDLFVVNEANQKNDLYENQLVESGTATFVKVVTGAIVNDQRSSYSGSWGDYDTDGDLDVYVVNTSNQVDDLYANNGDGTFTKITTGIVVTDPGWGVCAGWGDYDNDGDLDLFVTNAFGGVRRRNYLYKNLLRESGIASFEKIVTGDLVTELGYSFGFAWGDYDADGDLDLAIAKTYQDVENEALFRNDNANGNHWIELQCEGVASNRSAIGATVRCRATINGTPVWQMDQVAGQSGYCGQRLGVHFGLGNAGTIDTLTIEWPSGTVDVLAGVAADRILAVREGGEVTGVHTPGSGDAGMGVRIEPNPFRSETTIRYWLSEAGNVEVRLFDLAGRELARHDRGRQAAGEHRFRLELPGSQQGSVLFCSVQDGGRVRRAKLLSVR